MKPVDSIVNDENQDVHLSGKCTNSSQNVNHSSKKKNALLSRATYDNVYSKKPIFRRKLIEKYSTARYNFNTKRIYGGATVSKKKCNDSSCSTSKVNSKNTRHPNHADNREFIADDAAQSLADAKETIQKLLAKHAVQSSADAERSLPSSRHETVANSSGRGETVPKRDENSVFTPDEKKVNPEPKLVPSRRTSERIRNGKISKNASTLSECKSPSSAEVRCQTPEPESKLPASSSKSPKNGLVGSDLRALIISRARSTDTPINSGSPKNLETAGSSASEGEDSDSDEYLTISYDGDSDSRFSGISDAYSEVSSASLKSEYSAALPFHEEFDSESVQKAETRDVRGATTKPPDTGCSGTVKGAELISSKISNTYKVIQKLPDSDSDSGLQLCSSDGEKSSSDQLHTGGQNVNLAEAPAENVEKSHKHSFSFKNTNDWVNNSSQSPDQSKLNSESNVLAPSTPILSADHAGECLSSDSNAISADTSVDAASNSRVDDSVGKLEAKKVTVSSKRVKPGKSSSKETGVQSNVGCENSCEESASSNQKMDLDEATNRVNEKSIHKWKLVPSAIYEHLAEYYETHKEDTPMPVMPKKRRKKGTCRLSATRRSFVAKKVPEEPVKVEPRDPYIDTLREWEIKEEVKTEEDSANPSAENVGMILHVGVNRPLFPEIYRNIIALNKKTDGEITDLWANFALTTLITDKSSKRFRSVFLPVVDTRLKSTVAEYQQNTGCKFQEVDLQKVTFLGSLEKENADGPPSKKIHAKKRKKAESDTKFLSPEFIEPSPKKRKSLKPSFYQVDFPTIPVSAPDVSPVSAPDICPKLDSMLCINQAENSELANEKPSSDVKERKAADQHSLPAAEYAEHPVEKLSDEDLLAKNDFKPCWVVLPRVPVLCTNTQVVEEDEEEDDEQHFFGSDHCSRTYGQMLDYRSRNLSLVFFHRIKRILHLQRQNNKLFRSCHYIRLRPGIDDELDEVNLDDDCPDTVDSQLLPISMTHNPLDILKTWKLNSFEAPLLKGIDVNANKFPIRFMNHQLLKSDLNAKWFILQLNKSVLNVIHHDNDCLPIELLFQIICRADLTKKVVCNTIGVEFNPDVLGFGVYGVPGLSEAVLVGPYETGEMQHDLKATVQLWNGETAVIPILETDFDPNTFFLWCEDNKVRSAYGRWWKPGDVVPCTSAANSTFMNHLFNPVESESSIERPVKVMSLLRQHPCLTYSRYDRGGLDVNIRLIHRISKLNYTASGMKVSERMAIEDFIDDDSPLLLPTKLRSRSKMPNYCEMVSPKMRLTPEPRSDTRREPKPQTPRVQVRPVNPSERLKMNTVNERLRRKEFSVLRSQLRSTVEARQDASLISILSKAKEVIISLDEDENTLKRSKRSLFFKQKRLIGKLRTDMRQCPNDHPCYRYSIELILNLGKCDQAEKFARHGLAEISAASSNTAPIASVNSDARPIESSKEQPTIESSREHSTIKSSKEQPTIKSRKEQPTIKPSKVQPIIKSSGEPSLFESSREHSTVESCDEQSTAESSSEQPAAESSKEHFAMIMGLAPAAKPRPASNQQPASNPNPPLNQHSRLKRSRNNKCLWRKLIEPRYVSRQQPRQQIRQQPRQQPRQQLHQQPHQQLRQQPHQQLRQQPHQQLRQQPHQQLRQQPSPQPRPTVSESSEICLPEGIVRSEHSYSKRGIGLRRNGRWASCGIPRKEFEKLVSTPSSLLVRCDQQATETSNEHDQVAVYLTENDLPITKLIIQRLKTVNENSRHLSPTDRRNQIIALIRKIVNETLTGTRGRANSSNQDERYLIPRLLLLQRLLEGANIRIRDCSKIRVIDQTIEISDDEDQDEFSIESMGSAGGDDNDAQMTNRRVYVKVSSAGSTQPNLSPLQNGITLLSSPAPVCSADSQPVTEATTIIDDQLSVENQVILSVDGNQVDISAYIDNMPAPKRSRRKRVLANAGQRKLTVLKRVNGAIPTDEDDVTEANLLPEKPAPDHIDLTRNSIRSRGGRSRRVVRQLSARNAGSSNSKAEPSNRSNTGSTNLTLQQLREQALPNSEVKLLQDMLKAQVPPASPWTRLYARKSYSSPNIPKLIAQRQAAQIGMLSPTLLSDVESLEVDDDVTDTNDADEAYTTELSDLSVDVADESPVSISDFMNVHPDLLGKPISPKKSPVTRYIPNILVKSCRGRNSSGSMVVIPLSGKKVPLPVVTDKRFGAEKRLRCPSFVPPSVLPTTPLLRPSSPSVHPSSPSVRPSSPLVRSMPPSEHPSSPSEHPSSPSEHPLSPSESVANTEEPTEMETFPLDEDAVDPLADDSEMGDDFESFVENESPTEDEPSTSRRSSMDSSTRLAIKSFASVHSFNDNCFKNMDRMVKF